MNGAPRPKSKQGCLGCLGRLLLILLLGGLLIVAIDAVFAPWSFFLGGHFHYLPMWQGWGRVHTAGGDYLLYLYLYPAPGGSSGPLAGYPHLSGSGYVCTPRGEKIWLTGGGMFQDKHIGIHPDGRQVGLYAHRKQVANFGAPDYRPDLDFHGTWQGDSFVGDDKGSFAMAFAPDGHLYKRGETPTLKEIVPVTLKEDLSWTMADFNAACARLGH